MNWHVLSDLPIFNDLNGLAVFNNLKDRDHPAGLNGLGAPSQNIRSFALNRRQGS